MIIDMKTVWCKSMKLFLLLQHTTLTRPERFEILGPDEPVVFTAGEDVLLPCYLNPNISAENFEVQWFKKDFTDLVHLYQESKIINENQNPSYRGRTVMFPEELKKGNVSLKLSAVRGSDGGRYKCFVQSQDWYDDGSVQLIIKGTHPVISIEGYTEGGIGLVCKCKDWFPDAEVIWVDSEGQGLTAEPTEMHKSIDGSVSLRRRVIVQEQSTNRFICQIQQQHLGLVRETDIEIPGEMFHRAFPWKVAFTVFCTLGIPAIIILVIIVPRCLKLHREKEFESQQRKSEFENSRRCAVDVTLDPDTANPYLILSEDGKQVRCGYTKQDHRGKLRRFTCLYAVQGKEGFASGRHYWEVNVENESGWALGVNRESVERSGGTASPLHGYWTVVLSGGTYWAETEPRVSLHMNQKPQKVGVYVNYEEGQVSFYNVGDKSHIYTFTGLEFTEKLYPYFNPHRTGNGINSAPLIIIPVSCQEEIIS